MKTLAEQAAELKAYGFTNSSPHGNVTGVAKLMVLVAQDVGTVSVTGRSYETIQADAALVMRAIMEGLLVL